MPLFFVIIKGSKQEQFKGELREAGHTTEIGGLRLSMELDVPLDTATGHASGKRQYRRGGQSRPQDHVDCTSL